MSDQPHMILPWIFDIPNQTVSCTINEDLSYVSLEGGTLGYTKHYQGQESHIIPDEWTAEKQWISDNFSSIVGTFQLDNTRQINARDTLDPERMIPAPNGVDANGFYLDHMQRPQDLMEGYDMALVGTGTSKSAYQTPDNGITIYKRIVTGANNTHYNENGVVGDTFLEHSQPCMMQPCTHGVYASSHDEMLTDGIDPAIIQQCKDGKWASPARPDLQKYYIYPTA